MRAIAMITLTQTLPPWARSICILFLALAGWVQLHGATFFGPIPYTSAADIPAGLYDAGTPTVLETFEDGTLDPALAASDGSVVPPRFEGLIDSVDADDGVIDGSGSGGHSWFVVNGGAGVTFTFPPGTTAAGLVWTDGTDAITFSAFGPGHVLLGTLGPLNGIADAGFSGATAEDRFFGVRDPGGIESIHIHGAAGGLELDHVQYESSAHGVLALEGFTFDSGGGISTSTGGDFAVNGRITPPVPEPMNGGVFTIEGTFQPLILPRPVLPATPSSIFDNAGGSENGGFGVTPTSWLAAKLCLGSQPYHLDSVSLLLSNGTFDGQPRGSSAFRLQLYGSDPRSGKPSIPLPVLLSLSGITNPFRVGYKQWVKWTTDAPFLLTPDTCYWVVLSLESGVSAGPIATFSAATGDAGTLGLCSSSDGGVTWGTPDLVTSLKMTILGTPTGRMTIGADLIADRTTTIPGGTGRFTTLPLPPSIDGDNLAFFGHGPDGQQGFYLSTRGAAPTRIVDLSSSIPEGLGRFTSFGAEVGIIIVSGSTAIFAGAGVGGQQGLYGTPLSPTPGAPYRIADTTTALPHGTGNFATFARRPSASGETLVFAATGTGGQQGIYGTRLAGTETPFAVADTTTLVPEGNGTFASFPTAPSVSGDTVVFAGASRDGQTGVYGTTLGGAGGLFKVADTKTTIPGGVGTFTSLGAEVSIIIVSGKTALFGGTGTGGRRGLYGVNLGARGPRAVTLQSPGSPEQRSGEAILDPGPPYVIVDTDTAIPEGAGTFTDFIDASVRGEDVAFLGRGTDGQAGIYLATADGVQRVVSVGMAIQGRQVSGLALSRDGFSEEGRVAFQAQFGDGSHGLYAIDPPPALFRISEVGWVEGGVRLSVRTAVGQGYVVEARADLGAGGWAEVPGTLIVAAGSTTQWLIPVVPTQPQQFYRVRQRP